MIRTLTTVGLTLLLSATVQAATVTILPGAGFNDTTAFTPVGGNNATNLGQARLNLFRQAASIWEQRIVSSQTIYVSADFISFAAPPNNQTCTSTRGVLGQAQANGNFKNFPGAPKTNVYYPKALANAIAGARVDGSNPNVDRSTADIGAEFNTDVDTMPGCLNGRKFYYGFDNNPGTKIDLFNVVIHELGHGLGFASFVDESTGQGSDPSNPDQLGIYDQFVFDETQNKFWTNLTQTQRVNSAINDGHLVWNGIFVNGAKTALKYGVTTAGHVQLYAPSTDEPGSSVSHWNDSPPTANAQSVQAHANASSAINLSGSGSAINPHLLLQPFSHSDVKAAQGVDLTICVMADIGWQIATGFNCPEQPTGLVNNTPLAFSITTAPSHGSLSGTAPSLSYTPSVNYSGADSFQFTVNDGKATSSPATVTISVAPNQTPVANAQSVQVVQNTAKAITLTATDADGDPLTYAVVGSPAHGALSGTAPNLTYTPAAGYTGPDSFTFKATDTSNADSNVATVSITVAAPAPAGGGGGGGAMPNLATLVLLLGWRQLRRWRALRV